MAASSMWATIDPESQFRIAASGISEDGAATNPAMQTKGIGSKIPHLGFGVTLIVAGALAYYVFENGAGARAGARVGRAKAGVEADLEGSKQ